VKSLTINGNAAGFDTIAITHSKDKVELAHKLGGDLVVSDGQALREAGGGRRNIGYKQFLQSIDRRIKGVETRWKIDAHWIL
jgi:hypothetical protein